LSGLIGVDHLLHRTVGRFVKKCTLDNWLT